MCVCYTAASDRLSSFVRGTAAATAREEILQVGGGGGDGRYGMVWYGIIPGT